MILPEARSEYQINGASGPFLLEPKWACQPHECDAQVSEAELAAIAKGAGGPDLDADIAEGAGGEATRRLLGDYETPNRCVVCLLW